MDVWDQIVVALWFLPVTLFIIIPLCISCVGILFSVLEVFRPVAGQKRKQFRTVSKGRAAVAA